MKIKNQFKYVLTDSDGSLEVAPLNEGDFVIQYEQESDGKYFYSKQFQGKITFTGAVFSRLRAIEQSAALCAPLKMQVFKFCNTGEELIFDGVFKLTAAEWDLDKCQITIKFEKSTPDKCLQDNKNTKINILPVVSPSITVKTAKAGGQLEFKICQASNLNGGSDPFYWCGGGSPSDENWLRQDIYTYDDHYYQYTNESIITWVREIVEVPCGDPVPPEWVLIVACAGGVEKYAKEVILGAFVNNSGGGYYELPEYPIGVADIDNGRLLNDVLVYLVDELCSLTLVKSDFFQINPDNVTDINYVTGELSKVSNLVLFQKSDVKRPTVNNATKADITFGKLMEMLNTVFNVYYSFEAGIFRLEHISYFTRNAGLNLTLPKFKKYVQGSRKYSYDIDSIPAKESWIFKEQSKNPDWVGVLDYAGECVGSDKKNEVNNTVDEYTTDLRYVLNNPASDSSAVSDLGFVLIATKVISGVYFVISENSLNDSLSWSKLIPAYHYYNRPIKYGKFNGVDVTFVTTKPFKKGEKISVPLCCGDTFNPNDTILTALGVGIVDKAKFNLRTSMLDLDLKYNVFL